MSDKITIKEVIGDGFDFLKSSETHGDLKNQMLEAYSNSTEYIGAYHVHTTMGPMVGAYHTETNHPQLFYIDDLLIY